ncbi:hypothetical protein BKA82DRAFT_995259 [Pisolithus tinctorius]|uniref:Uncharacterized protein n=1 Tax=Pisolithus tinctorius Marx 270 TaxID=870435 RepID=A0A0C3PQI8_PISTI|nr:hypothetical protein BKA82DRAFT_995259 [Pisolithus tinctorius]KIO10794.1 hypothetical protein M404DRAFT_995259 [Pisolithus tinctorius Marx 270]
MAFWNARDLPLNSRGIACNQSPGISIAKSFETKSCALFLVYVATCTFFYGLGFGAFTEVVYSLSPNLGSWKGNSILDYPLLLVEDILFLHIHKSDDALTIATRSNVYTLWLATAVGTAFQVVSLLVRASMSWHRKSTMS